jgi:transposase InsO family protein
VVVALSVVRADLTSSRRGDVAASSVAIAPVSRDNRSAAVHHLDRDPARQPQAGRDPVDGPGRLLDNAAAEAFNSIIKVEYIHRHPFRTRSEARLKTAIWIVYFYNARRRHSACDGMSPIDFERLMAEARAARVKIFEAGVSGIH